MVEILVRVALLSQSANGHRDGPPEPGILVSVVTVEAMQLRGVSKMATLSWTGHGFGLRCAQLLTLNPKSVHISACKTLNNPTTDTTGGADVQSLNPTPTTHYHTTGRKDEKH